MSKTLRSNIEMMAQIGIAIAVLVIAGVVAKRSLFSGANPGSRQQIAIGERLSIPDAPWGQNEKSLVFFLMKDCKYCTASAPFYRQLVEDASRRNVKSLAILPDTTDEAIDYVRSLNLPIEDVRTGALSSYKILGTPTIVLVDQQGIVKRAWFGADPAKEKQMREELLALFDDNSL